MKGSVPPIKASFTEEALTARVMQLVDIPISWVLPPLSNSWIIHILWLYIALNRTPTIDCSWVGAVPNL